jgi:ATP-binding cassette subfamily B protein
MRRRGYGSKIERPESFRAAVARLVRYFGGEWPSLIVVGIAIAASALLKAIAPALIGNAISNHIEIAPDASAFVRDMLVVLGVYAGAWLADALNGGFMVRAGNRLVARLRSESFNQLQRLSMSYFDRRGIGDIVSRVTNDIEMIYNALTSGFGNLLGGLMSTVGMLVAMLALDLRLSLVVLTVLPLMVIITARIGRRVRTAFRENQRLVGKMNAVLAESITSIKVTKTFHRGQETIENFERVSEDARAAGERAETASFILHPMMRVINGIALALVVAVGGTLVVTVGQPYTVGLITAFILYSRRFLEPLRQVTEVYNLIQSALAGAERVFELMDAEPEVRNAAEAKELSDIRGDVRFEQVSFGYLPDQTVLDEISFEANSGETIAIVGPTGAGKTTLVNLLSRFYDVREGSIRIDGRDVREIDIDSLRTRMGVVLQEPYFFADTIAANIRYGKPSASAQEVERAASIAEADQFIRRLPDGYETVLLERGLNLSEGERQLLAIARAVLADPKILVLDEATSSVDSLTERLIQRGLLNLMEGRTSFVIAHRLSTIRNADRVLVLHDHRIVESGTHDELMEKQGFYARLYRMQFEKAEITESTSI